MIPLAENIAQNIRLNSSLKSVEGEENTRASFSLYLSMLHPDLSQYSRFSEHHGEHDCSYSGIERGAYRHARKYARADDYSNANVLNSALQQVNKPMALILLYQSFFPQALHHKSEDQQIPDDISENTAFFTQHPSFLVENNLDEVPDMYNTVTEAKTYSF